MNSLTLELTLEKTEAFLPSRHAEQRAPLHPSEEETIQSLQGQVLQFETPPTSNTTLTEPQKAGL